jgi:hypothetical protein
MPKQQVAVELYYNGVWNDVASLDDVYTENPIVITHGGGEEGAAPRPCRLTFSLANDDDRYRPSNPTSALYGLVGRNTPARVKVGGTIRGVGEASFAPDQTDDFRRTPPRGKAWVDVDAAGLLQRIGQWSEPLSSPFRQYNETLGTVGYWSGEQARGTTEVLSSTGGTKPGDFNTDFSADSQQRPPGSGPLIDLGENGEAGGYFAPHGSAASTAGWQLSWVARYGALDPAGGDQDVFDWETTDDTGYGLYLNPNGNMNISSSRNGTVILNSTASAGGYDFKQWTLFSLDAQYSAGTTTVWINWTNPGGTASGFMTASFAGGPATLRWWDLSRFAGVPSGSTFGHVLGTYGSSLTATADLFSAARKAAFNGYAGERASVRFGRLCDLKGIPYFVSDLEAQSALMGPQGVDTFANHLLEIAATDDALIFDFKTDGRLYLLCHADRVNQAPALALDAANPTHLSKPPREVLNDLDPHNIVTAAQRDGGDYTMEDATSAMGSQPPPAGVGEYRQRVDVNVADEAGQLPQVAAWWLAKGTNPRPRFPTVVVDLAAAPALIPAVEAVNVGSVITIANYREYLIRLHVLGWTETIGTHTRTVAFTCVPDDAYNVGTLTGGRRLQANYTAVVPALNAVSTTLTLFTGEPLEQWRPGASGVHILLGGEEIILGTIGARTGTNPYSQVVTGCTRSVNGVAKAHTITELVKVKDAIRLDYGRRP